MGSNEKAILRTLIYSDIFACPLSLNEVCYFLHAQKPLSPPVIAQTLDGMTQLVHKKNDLYCLAGKETIIAQRLKSRVVQEQKMSLAQTVSMQLARIPTVLFIGVSGSLAAGNAKKQDDIDFFVITSEDTLFSTRMLLLLFLELMGRRRHRRESTVRDRICLNLLITETALALPKSSQDIYTAREIAQLTSLFDRNQTYQRFLQVNDWTRTFLPNAVGKPIASKQENQRWVRSIFRVFEPLASFLQLSLINRHKTREIIREEFLAFYPHDTKARVLAEFESGLRLYEKYYKS